MDTLTLKDFLECRGQTLSTTSSLTELRTALGSKFAFGKRGTIATPLPSMKGLIPKTTFTVGSLGGQTEKYLSLSEMPLHNHLVQACNDVGTSNMASGSVWFAQTKDDAVKKKRTQ
jgi:microcystin-dependent protein